MERKLASLQRIISIEKIPGADSVELAHILGWTCIVKMGEFHSGDMCVFFEIDSILPEEPWAEFMRPKHFRVKTMKSPRLGVVSQGLALPLSIIEEEMKNDPHFVKDHVLERLSIGDNVTEFLRVKKYEPPTEAGSNTNAKGQFPTLLVPKTDEMRIQSFPSLLDEIRRKEVYATIKYDGTSCTYISYDDFKVCSRNQELNPGEDIYWKLANKYGLPEKLPEYCKTVGKHLAIQGEGCGKLVKGHKQNAMGLKTDELFVFGIFDIDNRRYMNYDVAKGIAKDLGLQFVPEFKIWKNFDFTIEELEKMVEGVCYPGTENQVEGLVFRPTIYTYSPLLGNQLSFKVIAKSYLLKGD